MKKFLKYFLIIVAALLLIFLLIGIIKPTQEYTTSVTVNAPVEKTFAIFMDTSRFREWMPIFSKMELLSGNPNEAGSKWKMHFHERGQDIIMMETVTTYKTNQVFAFNLQNEVINSDNEVLFTPKGNSTQITAHCKSEGGNIIWKSLFVFFTPGMKQQSQQIYNDLKRVVENTE